MAERAEAGSPELQAARARRAECWPVCFDVYGLASMQSGCRSALKQGQTRWKLKEEREGLAWSETIVEDMNCNARLQSPTVRIANLMPFVFALAAALGLE